MANVQISEELFFKLFLLLEKLSDYEFDDEQIERLMNQSKYLMGVKLDSIVTRETFSKYRMSSSAEEKEKLMKAYLERINVHADWRY